MIGTRTFFDALGVKIRVHYKAIPHRAGHARRRHPMKSWLRLEHNEGAKFGLRVINELKNRAVEDVLISVVDGLKC
jgi:putative transposase